MKVNASFIKSLKDNKNKIGLLGTIKKKIENFEKIFLLSRQKITTTNEGWEVKKIDATSIFGAYGIIIAKNIFSKKVIYDFYFKNAKSDMGRQEIEELKEFLLECEQDEVYNGLQNFEDL